MSVINQMLKDLDKRSPESNNSAAQPANLANTYSPIKIAISTALFVLFICLISFYIWQLTGENEALRAEKKHNAEMTDRESKLKDLTEDTLQIAKVEPKAELAVENEKPVSKTSKVEAVLASEVIPNKALISKVPSNKVVDSDMPLTSLSAAKSKERSKHDLSNKVVSENEMNTPPQALDNSHNLPDVIPEVKYKKANVVLTEPKDNVNKMSVSRRQLSASELAQQKLVQVEKALAANKITKAEKLLEDVVIITPKDSQSRKKLAALWFGRQAYQDAVNLLSQGIALDSKDSSLRQMKARIHLKQGQARAALNTLRPLAKLKDEQYQIMLANTAQQAQHNKAGVDAYQMLISMQPEMGRWHLGLAVLYDKDSQFKRASEAYNKALTKNDLSVSSEQFVKERIQVIGQ
jgi:MSHA biogenesis protein MshN